MWRGIQSVVGSRQSVAWCVGGLAVLVAVPASGVEWKILSPPYCSSGADCCHEDTDAGDGANNAHDGGNGLSGAVAAQATSFVGSARAESLVEIHFYLGCQKKIYVEADLQYIDGTINFGLAADSDGDSICDSGDNCPNRKNPANTQPADCNGGGDTDDPGEAVGEQCDQNGDGRGDACSEPTLVKAVSRKTHGIAGTFNIDLSLLVGGECP